MEKYVITVSAELVVYADDEADARDAVVSSLDTHPLAHVVEVRRVDVGDVSKLPSTARW